MKISDRPSDMVRLSVLEHLRVVHGIKLKNCGRKKERRFTGGTKVFGVPLESLPLCYIPQCGLLPCFLVDACEHLLEHAGTDGLFRKSGSVVRLRTLRAKLDHGEACLSTALPCDVASLLKLFCRELPDPLFPSDLTSALLKAQLLPTLEERALATQLLSCLLPDRNSAFLSYFFHFLSKVSHRSAENRMTNSNLAVIFAPSLLPPSHGTEGMDTYMKLKAVQGGVLPHLPWVELLTVSFPVHHSSEWIRETLGVFRPKG
uniref:Rho-GAP domain-containing protein n=1 Tax=Hucho hucho TaxID=62062 RepID=A0A4W5JRQ5_9TELE